MNFKPVLFQIIVALLTCRCWSPDAYAQPPIVGVEDSKDAEDHAEMPDISGTWGVETNVPGVYRTAEVIHSKEGSDFVLRAHVENAVAIQHFRWNASVKQFEGKVFGSGNNVLAINILIPEDANTIRVQIVSPGPDRVVQKEGKWIRQFSNQVALDKGATKPVVESKIDPAAAVLSPVHQPLIQQVGASESAAAAEAQRIRDLQANGQAESNKGAIAEHQRKLASLLSTAFDQKLQLEELQVKELQTRLSQLERQIGQRKQLREKIIQRRVAELMEGETLKWDSRSAYGKPITGTPIGLSGPAQLSSTAPRPGPMVDGPGPGVLPSLDELSPPYYQEMGRKLDAVDRAVRDAEELVKTTEIFVSKQVKSASDLAAARLQLADAIRSRSLMKEEYIAAVRDLEIQLELAMAEFEAASRSLERAEQLFKAASISSKEVLDAQLKRTQTRLAMERVKVWLAVCVKAGEQTTNSERSPPSKTGTTENNPSAAPIQRHPKLPQPATADSLLKILQNDRDPKLILEAVRQLSTMNLKEATASFGIDFLNALSRHDLDYPHQPNRQPAIDYYATEVLKKFPPSARIPTAIAALKNGKSGVKLIGIWGLFDDSSLWKYGDVPEFPELAYLLFAAVTNESPQIRGASRNFLVTTLPFTAINLTELTTEERRNTVQRFAESVPRVKVEQVIVDAINDKDVDVVLGAIFQLKSIPTKLADLELGARCAGILTQILDGKFQETATTPSQKGQALSGLAMLRANAAPAVPTLIRLLKSTEFPVTDSNERGSPANSVEEFSRRKVLMTLGRIGTAAKDALPLLEDEFKLAERKEREDALLSGNTKSNGPTRMADSYILQTVIRSLKGEQSSMFRGRDFGVE